MRYALCVLRYVLCDMLTTCTSCKWTPRGVMSMLHAA